MARLLSQSLYHICSLSPSPKMPSLALSSLAIPRRSRSHQSGEGQLIEISIESDGGGGGAQTGIQKLEEAINRIVVERAAPGWLPFVPGSSYWVPPRRPCNIVELMGKLADRLTEEESMSLTTLQGWPCSSFFIKEITAPAMEVEVRVQGDSENASQPEDQEG